MSDDGHRDNPRDMTGDSVFERFTDAANLSLFFARMLAKEIGGEKIEPEHLFLALLRADRGPLPRVFAAAEAIRW